MRAETRTHRNRVSDPGPNWIRSGQDLLKTDPVERMIYVDPAARPSRTATLPTQRTATPGNRLKLAPTLPAIDAPDSLPPIDDDEDAFMPSCRAAVDLSYAGGSAGIRPAGGAWSDTVRRRYAPTGDILLPSPPAHDTAPPDRDHGDHADSVSAALAAMNEADEQSTGLFEPGEEPYATFRGLAEGMGATGLPGGSPGGLPVATAPLSAMETLVPQDLPFDPVATGVVTAGGFGAEPSRPSLRLVRSVSAEIEDEFVGMRAAPLAMEPRPVSDEVVDWPPPRVRPTIDYPDDWSSDDVGNTLIVIDPVHRSHGSSRARVILLDMAAWVVGFLAMFFTGLVTTCSAALVFFAMSL